MFARMLPQSVFVPRTWNLVASAYSTEIAPTFSSFAQDALEFARVQAGERLLDVATGPGTVALAAVRAGARVSAIDFSPQMIAELRARFAREGIGEIDARVGDATALPYEVGAFDVAASMFAFNLIANRAAAFRELHRVLRRGGRAVVGTPTSFRSKPGFAEIRAIIQRALPELDLDYDLPLDQPAELLREMIEAGFVEVEAKTLERSFGFRSIADAWGTASRAGAPIAALRETIGDERWSRASEVIVRDLERRFGAGPQSVEMSVNVARGRKG
jgi:ubiquinone/menaquinone biosynthesis C-methylase UbiE